MKKAWIVLSLLFVLVVGTSFAGCISSGSSSQTQTPTTTPTPTPHPSKALVGFVIGFKYINFSTQKPNSTTWISSPFECTPALILLVQPYLTFPNGTRILMIRSWEKTWHVDYFYVLGFNRTQGWHGLKNYGLYYALPLWGNTTLYFSTIWNKTEFYDKVVWELMGQAKIQLRLGISCPFWLHNLSNPNFTRLIEHFTRASPPPVIVINWTPGQSLDKVLSYEYTENLKGPNDYGYKFKVYVEIWIKPVYMPWGQYPSMIYPWEIPGNNYR